MPADRPPRIDELREGDEDAWSDLLAFLRREVGRLEPAPGGPARRTPSRPDPRPEPGARVDPEDLISDAVIELLESIDRLGGSQTLPAFLRGVVWRCWQEQLLRPGAGTPGERRAERHAAATPPVGSRNIEANELLESILRRLRGSDRELFQALFVEGRAPREIADRLGVSSLAVRLRKHRLIEKLRRRVRRLDPSRGSGASEDEDPPPPRDAR